MKKNILLFFLPFISLAQSTLITAGTSGNVQIPNLTYSQITAIPSPVRGMKAYDTDYGCERIYNGSSWRCHDTPQNQPNLLTTALKADNSTNVQQTYNDSFSNGSVIVTGTFMGSITFGTTTLTSSGGADIFMVKYDMNGSVLWAFRIGGAGNGSTLIGDDVVTDVAVESGSQNFYIVGRIGSVSVSGAMTGATINGTDGFIAKFDANGTLLWSNFFSGTSSSAYDGLTAMSILGSDIYVCGYQAGGATLGSVSLGATNSHFIAKYNSGGTAQWAYEVTGAIITDVACNSNRVAVTGGFFSSVNLGGTTYTTTGLYDIFVLCLDNLGSFQWGQTFGTTGADYGNSLTFRNNKLVITGTYNGLLNWGNTTLSTNGNDDVFLAQYDVLGNKEWIKGFIGSSAEGATALKTDYIGNVYLLGSMGSRLWVGSQFINSNTFTNIFVAKFDPIGDCIWVRNYTGNTTTIYGRSISVMPLNGIMKIYISGSFNGTNVQFGHSKLTSGSSNMFLATITEN